jgi:hypothetical protein
MPKSRLKPLAGRPEFPPLESMDTLTVGDLLEARNRYHAALLNLRNVLGTAVGRYRMRIKDVSTFGVRKKSTPRTLSNSEVTRESWPAVLVFVREWQNESEIEARQRIPQFLFLQDGRAVPTCVILLELSPAAGSDAHDLDRFSFHENMIGGGCGIYTRVQGKEHLGTVACLMTDQERTYALTARHVVGPAGQSVLVHSRGEETEVGVSDAVQARDLKFRDMYPEYCEEYARVTIDAGFVRIEDARDWTSKMRFVGELGDIADLHCANITLGLIGTPVRAVGAVSGDRMRGEICALFPRYRTIGGVDSLADVFISARTGKSTPTRQEPFEITGGDSGALWVLDSPGPKTADGFATPVAVTWGVVDFTGGGVSRQVALASFMSNICKATGMDIVTRMNIGYRPVWGAANHRSFAETAPFFLPNRPEGLRAFLAGTTGQLAGRLEALRQLAVLPDRWCYGTGRGGFKEGPNHYADLDLTVQDTPLYRIPLDKKSWLEFYRQLDSISGERVHRGMLPFRIGHVYRCMVDFLKKQDLENAFGAAGVLIHYVADACNPAHVTRYTKGDPEWSSPAKKFHKYWDNDVMPDAAPIRTSFRGLERAGTIDDESAVRDRALALMTHTLKTVPIADWVVGYGPDESMRKCREFAESQKGRAKIADCVARAFHLLNSLWISAWRQGGGARIPARRLARFDVSGIAEELLNRPAFIPSRSLEDFT